MVFARVFLRLCCQLRVCVRDRNAFIDEPFQFGTGGGRRLQVQTFVVYGRDYVETDDSVFIDAYIQRHDSVRGSQYELVLLVGVQEACLLVG